MVGYLHGGELRSRLQVTWLARSEERRVASYGEWTIYLISWLKFPFIVPINVMAHLVEGRFT